MATGLKLLVVPALMALVFFSSCKKSEAILEKAPEIAKPVDPGKPADTTVTPPPVTGRIIPLGTGSGNLIIDGSTLSLKCNDVIQIQTGTYSTITVRNINAGCPITIQNKGLVQVSGNTDHWLLANVSNLVVTGNGDPNISKGFVSRDNPQHRSIILTGAIHDLTIQNFAFKNIGDYVVYRVYSNVAYVPGDESTYTNNLKFFNIDCENTSSFLQFDGGTDNGIITGLAKNLEIAYLSFKNSNCGHVAFIGNADDYNIHHNTITDINPTNDNHNGIFTIKGTGSFHHNLVRNHQGNAIRAWAKTIGTTPKDVLIYNNTVVNSRKYSAFEVQSFSSEMMSGKTTYSNIKVYNNICGDLNKSGDWVGVILDVYSLEGGKCEVYNNTGFNFPSASQYSKFTNTQANQNTIATNNSYFATAQEAGIADINALTIQK
jgi:hypothetical protein